MWGYPWMHIQASNLHDDDKIIWSSLDPSLFFFPYMKIFLYLKNCLNLLSYFILESRTEKPLYLMSLKSPKTHGLKVFLKTNGEFSPLIKTTCYLYLSEKN